MGLYLCVFEGDEELEGVEVGSYEDFNSFRKVVETKLESGGRGSRYPLLMLHSDSDGEWSADEVLQLRAEIEGISRALQELPSIGPPGDWQEEVMRQMGIRPSSLYECFIDVDGEPLLERMIQLCDVALESSQPILFQ